MYWRRSELYRHWLLVKVFEAGSEDCITIMIFPKLESQATVMRHCRERFHHDSRVSNTDESV